MPGFLVNILERCIEPLRNEEAVYQAIAARAAFVGNDDFQDVIKRFREAAEPYEEKPAAVIPVNEAARAWFIANEIPIIQ